ncbi:MAG: potassium channel family protein [Bacilli bacterium]|nr:potassium channel family protein [Bacilli bacterium]
MGKKPVKLERRNKIIHYMNAVIGILIAIAGFGILVVTSIDPYGIVALLLVLIPIVLSLILETNVLLLRPTKRGRIEAACFLGAYALLLVILLFAGLSIPNDATEQEVASIIATQGAIVMIVYMFIKCARVILNLIFRGKTRFGWISYTLTGIAFGLTFLFCLLNRESPKNLFSFAGFVIIVEGFAHVMLSVVSGFDGKAIIRVMIKTHVFEVLMGMMLVIAGASVALLYLEESIPTYGDALWYCFAVVTTIGFGDFTALTFAGRLISVFIGIYGILVVAVLTSTIVNVYNETSRAPKEVEQKKEDENEEQ